MSDNKFHLIILVIVSFVVVSCGGGGSNGYPNSDLPDPLPAPEQVAVVAEDGQVTLTWQAVDGADGYHIYYGTNPNVVSSTNAELTATSTTIVITGLTNGSAYYFAITAENVEGEGFASSEISATPEEVITNPVTGSATSITDTTATLNGSAINAAGDTTSVWFEYGSTDAYGEVTPASNYSVEGAITVSMDIVGLEQSTIYHFRIVIQNGVGITYGTDNSFTTPTTPTVLITGLSGPSRVELDSGQLYWTDSNGINKYLITHNSQPCSEGVMAWEVFS